MGSDMALVSDLAAVLLFVGIGRSVHDHGISLSGMASTAWPFLSGLAAGWIVLVARRSDVSSLRGGAAVWLLTVAVGMGLRMVAGQGIAAAFVVVALIFLGATMLGGRLVVARLRRRDGSDV